MFARTALFLSFPAALALFFACGPSEQVFSSTGTGTSDASTTTTGRGGSGGEATTSSTTASSMGGAEQEGPGPGPGPVTSSAVSSSASSSTMASSSASSGTGGSADSILCGAQKCPEGGQSACCWSNFATPPTAQCVSGPPSNDNCLTDVNGLQTRIECQLPKQCPTTGKCCAHRNVVNSNFSYYDVVACSAMCDYPDILLCNPNNPGYCPVIMVMNTPTQTVCKQSQLLPPGYYVCGLP